ncbi:MAG: STAS domain-containing protein [Nitrospinae bacterium]|nr:STAS domain-containing protein [Nitrospinota bacterium]
MGDALVTVTKEGNVHIVKFSDKLTYAKLQSIKAELTDKITFEEMGQVIIDLSSVKILDSAGIGLVVSLYKSAVKEKGKLVISCQNAAITDILKTVGVNKIIKVLPTLDEALNNV